MARMSKTVRPSISIDSSGTWKARSLPATPWKPTMGVVLSIRISRAAAAASGMIVVVAPVSM